MNTAKLLIRDWTRRLAPLVAAGAAVLAALCVGAPALAQSHDHHGEGGGLGGWVRGANGWRHVGPGGLPSGGPGWGRPPSGMGEPPRGAPGSNWGRGPQSGYGRGGPPANPGWDQRRYNGYWVGGRWYYGAPEPPAFASPDFRPGFTPWRRGSFLPPAYQGFAVDDYGRFHLRRPPYGYHWVQVGGEFLLVSVSTGLIFDVVTGD